MSRHNFFADIDPLVMMTAMLIGAKERASKPPPPPTPGQIERRRIIDERNAWNEEVAARKVAKKPVEITGVVMDQTLALQTLKMLVLALEMDVATREGKGRKPGNLKNLILNQYAKSHKSITSETIDAVMTTPFSELFPEYNPKLTEPK